MDRMLVRCPETANLEEIAYDDHPLGRLILGCSRFEAGPIRCSRTCAAILDRTDRGRTDIEIVCASADSTKLELIRRRRKK
jgi:inorganic pyrophosphatase